MNEPSCKKNSVEYCPSLPQQAGLAYQVNAVATLITTRLSANPSAELTLLGHSVGAHICLEAIRRVAEAESAAVGGNGNAAAAANLSDRVKLIMVARFLNLDLTEPH